MTATRFLFSMTSIQLKFYRPCQFQDFTEGAMNASRMCRILGTVLSALALIFAPAVSASPTGSIAGSVKDQTGALVSGAKLTLISISTNAKMEAVSYGNGGFQFLQLAPAASTLHVEAGGFKKVVVDN